MLDNVPIDISLLHGHATHTEGKRENYWGETVPTTKIQLDINRFTAEQRMARSTMGNFSTREHLDEIVFRLEQRIATQHLKEISYPSDWKEAFKERWFPKWLLQKFPVKYTRYDAKVLYPLIQIPEQANRVEFTRLDY